MVRLTAGRQRLEMKKIENEEALQVTFSKRRSGLFKKASEISILCGAEMLIVTFSPANRPYIFASPDFETIKQRFLTGNPVRPSDPYMNRGILIRQLLHELANATSTKDAVVRRLRSFKQFQREYRILNEDHLSLEELEHFFVSTEELKRRFVGNLQQVKYATMSRANPMPDTVAEQTFVPGQMNPVHENPNVQHTNMPASMGFTDGIYMGGEFGFQTGESSASGAFGFQTGELSASGAYGFQTGESYAPGAFGFQTGESSGSRAFGFQTGELSATGVFGFQTGESSAAAANMTAPGNLVNPTRDPTGSQDPQAGGIGRSVYRKD